MSFNAQLTGKAIGIPVPGPPIPRTSKSTARSTSKVTTATRSRERCLPSLRQHIRSFFRSHDGTFVLMAADGSTLIGSFLGNIRPDSRGSGRPWPVVLADHQRNRTVRWRHGLGDFTSELGIGAGGSRNSKPEVERGRWNSRPATITRSLVVFYRNLVSLHNRCSLLALLYFMLNEYEIKDANIPTNSSSLNYTNFIVSLKLN